MYKLLEYKGGDEVLLDQVQNNDKEIKEQIKQFPTMNTKLIFPLCSKRCFNLLESLRRKKEERKREKEKKKEDKLKQATSQCKNSCTTTPAIWDKDGTDGKKSSIRILIDWLTTEGNLSDYFGGLDKHGKTNAN
jgi:guanylate kinase